ncbi:MAG: sulfatase-like hydrolase/transferase, partial [Nitrospinaceae bacterium]|nr:sulfatase-like hydrolase/transferase [Nitrospinaceae bacterium]
EEHRQKWNIPGQKNPFYCAMVDQLDYYLGRLFDYLESADDPRWPGHTLSENTYVILTSDNGGAEAEHMVTDNYPLDRGKISLREGGTRVPLIITGPGIPAGVQTDVMVNGLDFYPTILSLVGAKKREGKVFDGCDLAPLLTRDPQDASLVRDASGKVRDTMVWHFPQAENTSSIRKGDYKLLRSYTGLSSKLALYRLYNSESGKAVRGDIEEMKDLSAEMPALTAELNARLSEMVDEMGGRIPYGNPATRHAIPNKEKVPTVTGHAKKGNTLVANYRNNGTDVVHADLIYTPNEGREWLRVPGWVAGDNTAVFDFPKGATHYFINLVDENNFLVIDPPIDRAALDKNKPNFTEAAHFAGYPEMEQGTPVDFASRHRNLSRAGDGAVVLVSENLENPNTVTAKT